MTTLGNTLSNVLVCSIDDDGHTDLGARFGRLGGDPGQLFTLRGREGIDALVGPPIGESRLARLSRRLSRLGDDTVDHLLEQATTDLTAGRTVVVVRHVDRKHAARQARLLRQLGAVHLHYSGRWTSIENCVLP